MEHPNQITDSIYWLGTGIRTGGAVFNPYLLVSGNEAVLFDPGPVSESQAVAENIAKICPLENVTHCIVHNTSPSACASLSVLQSRGMSAKIYAHQRGQGQMMAYGLSGEIHYITEAENYLELASGRELIFIETPYLPFFDSYITYDTETFSLFSSNLFSGSPRKWDLRADTLFYKESLKSFHERLMPGNDFLRPVMDLLSNIQIKRILTQRGSVIEDNIDQYIKILKDLECGVFLNPLKNDISRKDGYINLSNKIVQALISIYGPTDVADVFYGTELDLGNRIHIVSYSGTGEELWDKLFAIVHRKKGAAWLTAVRSVLDKLMLSYNAALPKVYDDLDREMLRLDDENIKLKERNIRLEAARESLVRCPVTNLRNESFLRNYLSEEIHSAEASLSDFSLCRIDIDRMSEIWQKYGKSAADIKHQTLRTMAYAIGHHLQVREHELFKNGDDSFSLFLPHTKKNDAVLIAENLRNQIARSEQFAEPVTVSIGVTAFSELLEEEKNTDGIIDITREKVIRAKKAGTNIVFSELAHEDRRLRKTVLVVDTDAMNLEILVVNFAELGIDVLTCSDGSEALRLIETVRPELVIAELMIPKLNGFAVRENMLADSSLKQTPYILLSHQKDEATIRQSIDMRIIYYLQKPYILTELLGLAESILMDQN